MSVLIVIILFLILLVHAGIYRTKLQGLALKRKYDYPISEDIKKIVLDERGIDNLPMKTTPGPNRRAEHTIPIPPKKTNIGVTKLHQFLVKRHSLIACESKDMVGQTFTELFPK